MHANQPVPAPSQEGRPPKRRRSVIRADIAQARLDVDVKRLEKLYREGGASHDNAFDEFLLPLARLLEDLGREVDALEVWRRCFEDQISVEAAFNIMRRRHDDASSVAGRLKKALGGEALEGLERLLLRPDPPPAAARHIAICGVSYCGSTILGRLLDSCAGFHDVSETHWLIDRRGIDDDPNDLDFTPTGQGDAIMHCWQCGSACTAFTPGFRSQLRVRRAGFYFRVAERVGAKTLVTSDKNFTKYAALDPLLRFDALVLFKSPLQAWQSFYRKPTPIPAEEKLERFIQAWLREYQSSLQMKVRGQKIFVFFDDFIAEPQSEFAKLTRRLNASPESADILAQRPQRHSIGGNLVSMDSIMAHGRIRLRELNDLDLPPSDVEAISNHGEINQLFDELKRRARANLVVEQS